MFIPDWDYFKLSAYCSGWLRGLSYSLEKNLTGEFHQWAQGKVGRQFSLTVESYIFRELAEKDEKIASEMFFDFLEGFFVEIL